MSVPSLSYLLLSSAAVLLVTAAEASAQSCTTAPSCSALGYTKSVSQCSGKAMIKCPFDTALVFCEDGPSCDSLGFTDTVSECPGSYVKCPTDSSKGKCDFEASPGDLKYSLRTSDHNGWLLCNGRSYSSSQYPELYAAISGSFGSYLPSYSGYFLKAASTSSAYSFKTAQQAGLPNITGRFPQGIRNYTPTFYGAFYNYAYYRSYWAPDTATDGLWLGFDASRSNSIYGRSSTVTPQNYSANVFIYSGRKKR
ncbi:MAG: tail fiber protein [Alphaproteobacteria bacterium]|nr:tail fiber protein [Alphaproteobacteria bacterium]